MRPVQVTIAVLGFSIALLMEVAAVRRPLLSVGQLLPHGVELQYRTAGSELRGRALHGEQMIIPLEFVQGPQWV